jgi:hypothetical protein
MSYGGLNLSPEILDPATCLWVPEHCPPWDPAWTKGEGTFQRVFKFQVVAELLAMSFLYFLSPLTF